MTATLGRTSSSLDGPGELADQRVSWNLSPSGDYATARHIPQTGSITLEVFSLIGGRSRSTNVEIPDLSATDYCVTTDAGDVYVALRRRRQLLHVTTAGAVRPIAEIAEHAALFPPMGDTVGLLETVAEATRISRVTATGVVPIAEVPVSVLSAVWAGGGRVVVNVPGPHRFCEAKSVDPETGSLTDLVSLGAASDDLVVDVAISSRLAIVSTTAGGGRIGCGRLPDGTLRLFPGDGRRLDHLGTSIDGRLVALCATTGATSALLVADTITNSLFPIDIPPLVICGPARFRPTEIVVPASDPGHPGCLLRIPFRDGRQSGPAEFDEPALPSAPSLTVTTIDGAGGPIEAIVLGDVATAAQVVVALHGGPFAAWRAVYQPFLAALAAQGRAVVAPNVRGSTGYGRAHAHAIRGQWGGPDLADVLTVRHWINAQRPGKVPVVVVGESYGGYLAALAALSEPGFAGCVALAPFCSGARMARHPGREGELVRRFGGLTSPDLTDFSMTAPTPFLLVHGANDETVPVGEAKDLATHLERQGAPVRLEVVPDEGHDLMTGPRRQQVAAAVIEFLDLLEGGEKS